MAYKVGDKFVIEIDSVMTNKKGRLYGIKGFKSCVFDDYGLDGLEHLERLEAGVNDESYFLGFNDGQEQGVEIGKSEAVRKIKDCLEMVVNATEPEMIAF